MKIVFRELGLKKFSKIVETTNIIGFEDVKAFCLMEIGPHMPKGEIELVPTDGLPELASNRYVVVHYEGLIPRGMGQVMIYN